MKYDRKELELVFREKGLSLKFWATEWALNIWDKYRVLETGSTVVDLGCGERFAAAMSLDSTIKYVGFDVRREMIENGLRVYPQFQWFHSDIKNEMYNPNGILDPQELVLPLDDHMADLVICASLFTHLENLNVAKTYLSEIERILKPGGHLWISWFRSPPNEICANAQRTVFSEAEIINMISGWLKLKFTTAGLTTEFHDQWVMLGQIPESISETTYS